MFVYVNIKGMYVVAEIVKKESCLGILSKRVVCCVRESCFLSLCML